jgi:hypothetical protein
MKIPVRCPYGCGWTLEMDFSKDHQHVRCHECLTEFCAICIGMVTVNVASRLPANHPMRKAHLN